MALIELSELTALIELMQKNDLTSLEVGAGDTYVSLSRQNTPLTNTTVAQTAVAPAFTPVPSGAIETAPMVGVFYSAPSPQDAPFVTVGQSVAAGQTLGIIEAMKIMNPLEATQSGIIEEILVQNGDVVQFGQPIVRYKA